MVKSMRSGACLRILSHVTLSKLLKHLGPQCPYLKNEENNGMYHIGFSLSRYPLARKGILFGCPGMEKSLDTRRR